MRDVVFACGNLFKPFCRDVDWDGSKTIRLRKTVTDPRWGEGGGGGGDARNACLLSIQILSFSCSFQQNNKLVFLPRELAPSGNPGSATERGGPVFGTDVYHVNSSVHVCERLISVHTFRA